ncbi:hypothetical protein SLS62_001359 [Diatrype stigma]|uniref:Rhodopsin domain-containing protein n=1 Tax=Diatrype stigma TaxID=117547 RepID=A0AAN9V8I6_9PEZI
MAPADYFTKQEFIDSAWEQDPIGARGFAACLASLHVTLLALSTIAVGLRVWARGWVFRDSKVWGWDDTLAVLSLLTTAPACIFAIQATRHGLGTRDAELSESHRALASLYLGWWQLAYAASTNMVKAGIAAALLRLATLARRYRYPVLAILAAAPLFACAAAAVLLYSCRPVGAQWDAALGPCPTRRLMADFSAAFTALTVALDWACAAIPYLLLRGLQMHARTKVSLFALLAFGGLAGVSALIRLPYLKYYYVDEDQLYGFGNIVLWSTVENAIGIIAASAPPVYKLFLLYTMDFEGSCANSGAGATETIGGTPLNQRSETPAHLRPSRARSMTSSHSDAASVGSGGWSWHHRRERVGSSREHIVMRAEIVRSDK